MIRVTDHAVVRYLERIVGLDIDNIRREIEESLGSPLAKRLIDFSGGAECRIKSRIAIPMPGLTATGSPTASRASRPPPRRCP